MLDPFRKWRADRRARADTIDIEARALLTAKGRAGALYDLAERFRAVGLSSAERYRIAAVMERVQRLSPRPPKADVASRMLYSD